MRAIIDGVQVEGTPDEVWRFLQLKQVKGTNLKPVQPMPEWTGPWHGIFPPPMTVSFTINAVDEGTDIDKVLKSLDAEMHKHCINGNFPLY